MKAPVTVCLLDSGLLRHSEAARRLCGGIDLSDEGGLFARCNEHGTRVAETVLAQCPQARLALVRIVDENGWLRSTEAIEAGFAWVLERLPELGPSVICAAFGDMFHYRADEPKRLQNGRKDLREGKILKNRLRSDLLRDAAVFRSPHLKNMEECAHDHGDP
ncbi:S8/S53 family peptidase, partial [Burkholderia gladioli]|nr:S8/S53 family peptidase [Burkholderia gladioli]